MRILLVTQYFYPEQFKSNDIAFELQKRGHEVTVLTGIPNYPQGKFFKGYGLFKRRKETINGVKVIRAALTPRGKGSGTRLAVNYLSWALCASLQAIVLSFQKHFDAIIVHETSPITQGYPALVVRKLQKIPIYFWVLDLWPESLQSAGNVTNKYVLNFFKRVTCSMYGNSKEILVSSKGFGQSILEKGDYAEKLVYFPNWAEDIFKNFEHYELPTLNEGFRVMFAGNIGEAQDFEHIMQTALLLREQKTIQFIFVGDGRRREWAEKFVEDNLLQQTVTFVGRYPIETMPSFFQQADVMLLPLKSEQIFSLTVPAKLQTYMAAGKPIVAMIDGESRKMISESGCGLSCGAGQSKELSEIIISMKNMPKEDLAKMGQNSREFYLKNFTVETCINHLCRIIGAD